MKRKNSCRLLAGCLALLFLLVGFGSLQARMYEGVEFPDQVEVAGRKLALNGIGLREKYWVDVYYSGLYLPEKTHDAKKVVETDEPKMILIHVVYHEVDPDQWVDGWQEGFDKNTPHPSPELKAKMATYNSYYSEPVKKGQQIRITYIPGKGTEVVIAGKVKGTIPGHDFMVALWNVWFGEKPATEELYEGMLGK